VVAASDSAACAGWILAAFHIPPAESRHGRSLLAEDPTSDEPRAPRGAWCRAGVPNSSPVSAARARARVVGSPMFDLQPRHRHRIPCVALHFASSKCVKLPAGLELVVLTASGRASADQVVARLPRRHENAQSQSESQSFAEPKARAGASIQPLSPLLTLRLPRGGAMPEHCLSMGSARPASFLGIESRRSEIESFIKAASRGPSCLFLSFFPPLACCCVALEASYLLACLGQDRDGVGDWLPGACFLCSPRAWCPRVR
jgi:hypothetical protein